MAALRDQVTIACPDHHQTLTTGLWNSFVAQNGVDFEIESVGRSIKAHRVLMDVFLSPDKLLETMGQKGKQDDIHILLDTMVKFMYTGQLTVSRQRFAALLALATDVNFSLLVDTLLQEQKKSNIISTPKYSYVADNSSENGSEVDSDSSFVVDSESSSEYSVEVDSEDNSEIDDGDEVKSHRSSKIYTECNDGSGSESSSGHDHVPDNASILAIRQIPVMMPCCVVLKRLTHATPTNCRPHHKHDIPVDPMTSRTPSLGDDSFPIAKIESDPYHPSEMELEGDGRLTTTEATSKPTIPVNVTSESGVTKSNDLTCPMQTASEQSTAQPQLNAERLVNCMRVEENFLSVEGEPDFQFQLVTPKMVAVLESGSLESQLQLEAEISKQLDHQFDQIRLEAEQSVQASLNRAPPVEMNQSPTARMVDISIQPETNDHTAGPRTKPRPRRVRSTLRSLHYQSDSSTPDTYPCAVCKRVFRKRCVLSSHLKSYVHLQMVAVQQLQGVCQPHVCEHCDSSFVSADTLVAHRATHATIKMSTCGICRRMFATKDGLRRHSKTHLT